MTPRLLLYGRHRLFPVAGKHLGQIQSQHRRLVATALSSSSSATRPTICFNTSTTATNQNRAAAIYCLFSDMSLRRPPLKEDGVDSDTSRKWRSHAISIDFGNYQDDEYSDINAITANTVTTYPSPCSWDEEESELEDPTDTACLMTTLQQDESTCTSTTDSEGNACSWCAVDNFDLCLNADQATLAEQLGGACDEHRAEEDKVMDPADTTCIVATLQQDEAACTSTMDADGRACEWCMVAQAQVCLNADQAQLAEQFGGSCGDSVDFAME